MNCLINRRQKIMFVIPIVGGGGAERVLLYLMEELKSEKWDKILITFDEIEYYKKEIPNDVKIIILKKKRSIDFFKLIFSLAQIIKQEKPDIVNSHLTYANILSLLSAMVSGYRGPIILNEHNFMSINLRQEKYFFIKKTLIKKLYPRAAAVISVSKGARDDLIKNFRVRPEKCLTIYNPVDIERIEKMTSEPIDHPWFTENIPLIISCGRLTKQKNYPLLLKAVKLTSQERDVRLVVMGDGELKSELESLALKMGLANRVEFLGFRSNPFKYLARAHVFVLSSSWEGFGNVIIEAMTCGVPVISTRCPAGPDEIIMDGKNGILVDVDNAEALSKGILRLLADVELRKKLIIEGKARAKDFQVEKIISQYEEVFDKAIC